MQVPDAAVASIVRGMAAYMSSVTRSELPTTLRPLRGRHHKMLMARRTDILAALDDQTLRALVKQWLDDKPSGIARRDADALTLTVAREDGWEELLAKEFPETQRETASDKDPEPALVREKERARKAKDEAKRARDEATRAIGDARGEVMRLEEEVRSERSRADAAEKSLAIARKELAAVRSEMDRELRKARRRAETAEVALEDAKTELRAAKPRSPEPERPPARVRKVASERPVTEPKKRVRLKAPQGRFEDDPETLAEWLARPQVHLLVDGYNVSKAEGGFGDLALETQRNRLIQELGRLARRHGIEATIVFDGSSVTPGTYRRTRGPVAVEYSRADEIADDHLIAKLEALPKHPVVLVTNDRELQHRAARLGATVATSNQLLGLIR